MNILDAGTTGGSKATIDLPAELIGQPSDLFNKVFEFVFDVLGMPIVELQARDTEMPLHRADAARRSTGH